MQLMSQGVYRDAYALSSWLGQNLTERWYHRHIISLVASIIGKSVRFLLGM